MNYVEHRFSLDVHETVSQVSVRIKKGNTAHRLLIHLTERGCPFHISPECYAVFTARKPDGKAIFNGCSIEDCVIIYDLTPQTVAAAGLLECEIMLYGADNALCTSASFNIIVEDTVYDEDMEIESEAEATALTQLISEATTLITDVEEKLENGEFVGPQGPQGEDYVLTEDDKAEIAEMAAELVDVPGSGGNVDLTPELKTALVNYYTHVMPNFDDTNGLAYINAILTALGAETREEPDEPDEPDEPVVPDEPDTPEVTLSSITATYSGGDVTVGTAVTALNGIVVTAHYSDGTSETVTGYTLSGTIAEGSNTVTVSYGGKTTTFTVTGVVEGGGGETEGTTVAMTKQFSGKNVIMKWYSDGGSTTATDCPGRDYLGILVSDNVFTEDTEVKITIVGSANLFDCWNVGCFDFASDGSFDTNDSVYYAVHFGTNAWANTGATHEINYTVKAGYNLIITAYGNFTDTTSVTVEVV